MRRIWRTAALAVGTCGVAVAAVAAFAPLGNAATLPTGGTTLATPVVITGLSVKDKANKADWSVQTNLRTGSKVYGDRTYTFTAVPAALVGAAWIRDAGDSKTSKANPIATFNISAGADVYIGLDHRSARPAWLNTTWTDTGTTETATTGITYQVFKKSFAAGAVALGPLAAKSGASVTMYTIAAVPSGPVTNDFSLTVTPGGQTVAPGGTADFTIHTAVVSGTPGPIAFPILDPLPNGITFSYSANPVAPGSDSVLTAHTSTTTPNGTVSITVIGFDGPTTHSQQVSLTVGTAPSGTSYEAEAAGSTLFGGAARRSCAFCSGGGEVGNILGHGKPDALQFNGVQAPADGVYNVTWYYVAGDPNGDTKCGGEPNPPKLGCRPGNIVVNGASQGIFQFPDTPDWHTLGSMTMRLSLTAGANTIKISSATQDVADIDRIVVEG